MSSTKPTIAPEPPVAMTIAGTDSGGAAGLAADLHSFARMKTHGVFAVTVVTAQNTTGIRAAQPIPADHVAAQIDALVDEFDVAAVKTGMLGRLEIVDLVSDRFGSHDRLVVDPVLVDRRRQPLFGDELVDRVRTTLLPSAVACTPNVGEAELLARRPISTTDDLLAACAGIARCGSRATVITGFEHDEATISDAYAVDGASAQIVSRPRIDTANVHGTGCTFAATLTALLAHGADLTEAIVRSGDLVHADIARAADWRLGPGSGPIDHLSPR